MDVVTGRHTQVISTAHALLYSDATLLRLLRSPLGMKVVSSFKNFAPQADLLSGLVELQRSSISTDNLPVLSVDFLMPSSTEDASMVDPSK